MKIAKKVANDADCKALLSDGNNIRFTPFDAVEHCTKPYAVYQVVSGSPENNMGCRPQIDEYTVQVDVYAKTCTEAEEVGKAIQKAIELDCYVTSYRGITREKETRLYRNSFDTHWWQNRD